LKRSIKKAADSLRWFSRPKPRLVQSRLAVNSYLYIILTRLDVKGEGLLRRQAHFLRLLHPDRMANECFYIIIIGHHLSSTGSSRPMPKHGIYAEIIDRRDQGENMMRRDIPTGMGEHVVGEPVGADLRVCPDNARGERNRRSIRLRGYDYSCAGMYFVTICTQTRVCLFGEIVDGEMWLNEYGCIVANEWIKTPEIRDEIELDEFVIMPNHFHGIVVVVCRGTARRAFPVQSRQSSGRSNPPLPNESMNRVAHPAPNYGNVIITNISYGMKPNWIGYANI